MSNSSLPPNMFTPSPGPNPYGPPPPAPAPSNSSGFKWVLGILVAALLAGVFVCCGGPLTLFYFGKQTVGPKMLPQVQANAKIREHLGDVHTCEWDFTATAQDEGEETMVFNLEGTRGKGVLIAETDSSDDERIVRATLRLPDGSEIEVAP